MSFESLKIFHQYLLQDSEKYVEQLLELFNRFSALVTEAFNDDPRFLTSRDKVRWYIMALYLDTCYYLLSGSFKMLIET